jgi:hypothetical protein
VSGAGHDGVYFLCPTDCARELFEICPPAHKQRKLKSKTTEKNMKTKTILLIALAAVIGGGVLWLAPYRVMAADTASTSHNILYYTCPMHPSVKSDKPGGCPICGMNLVPVYDTKNGAGTNTPPTAAGTNTVLLNTSGCCSSGRCH